MPEREIVKSIEREAAAGLSTNILLFAIRLYKLLLSPIKPKVCRFYPSCSQYMYEAIAKYGAGQGLWMGIKRIIKCHPFNPGGYHPVE